MTEFALSRTLRNGDYYEKKAENRFLTKSIPRVIFWTEQDGSARNRGGAGPKPYADDFCSVPR